MPRVLKTVLLVLLAAIVVVVLFTTVFPWVERQLEDPTLGATDDVFRGVVAALGA